MFMGVTHERFETNLQSAIGALFYAHIHSGGNVEDAVISIKTPSSIFPKVVGYEFTSFKIKLWDPRLEINIATMLLQIFLFCSYKYFLEELG